VAGRRLITHGMPNPFSRYQLRTTDVAGARAFYGALFGGEFWGPGIDVTPLPTALAGRGVPANWLGHIGVEDVVPPMYRFMDAGATRLGAPPPDGRDTAGVVLRDPLGANVALTPLEAARAAARVAWHLHLSRDEERALEVYASVLEWTALERQDLGERGRHVTFAWDAGGRTVGSTSDMARRPHVHAQWLFFFATPDFDALLARVRELGGLVTRPERTADGHRVVACDDPQGAAFGLYEAESGTRKTSIA
jgi:predicted enzyme related to lactoylglutathione lyase